MSNTDSFIEEVTEEVRKDRLFATLKRWGWVAGLAVLVLVGGAAWNEWRKSAERTAAQSFGDSLIAGLSEADGGEALLSVETSTPQQKALASHLAAADALNGGDTEAAIEVLEGVAAQSDAPAIYRELAAFKAALALPPETPAPDRLAAFDALSTPGAPFAVLAQEQRALILIETGRKSEAIEVLSGLLSQSGATPGLQQRATELIVALGGTPEAN